MVLQDILSREFSSRTCRSEFGYEVKLTEKSLTGSETGCRDYDEYSSITLNDFRSNFDWEEEYKVYISYPYMVETYVSESFKSLSKEDVREMMSGSETDLEGNHDPLDCDEHGVVELDVEHVEHSYQVWVNNFRLKESVVEKTNVSGT